MGAANSRAFGLPGVLESAMGFGRPPLIGQADRAPSKTGGIQDPRQVELQPGQVIVRFGQKRLRSTKQVDYSSRDDRAKGKYDWHERGAILSHRGLIGGALEGEWWLAEADFDKVQAYAKTQHITVAAAVSALCVVPKDWSDLDVIVRATLMAPLMAYRGRPNPANSRGTHHVAKQVDGEEIEQLFIPGLGNGDVLRQALMWGPPTFLKPFMPR